MKENQLNQIKIAAEAEVNCKPDCWMADPNVDCADDDEAPRTRRYYAYS